MAARRTRTHQVLDLDTAGPHEAQSARQDGQTPLDYQTGLSGVETRVGAGALRRAQLAWVPPPCHALHRSLWVPGGRAEPFFPLCPRRSSWTLCPPVGAGLPPARITAPVPSAITRTRSRRYELSWRACCCGNCRIAPTADLLPAERRRRNRFH